MKKRTIAIIVVLVVLIGSVGIKLMFDKIEKNLNEMLLIELSDTDLTNVKDGVYFGSYASFPVSVEVQVTIKDHSIINIELLKHDNGKGQSAEAIVDTVISKQSIEIDIVTGATFSSKVILLAIQDALTSAFQ